MIRRGLMLLAGAVVVLALPALLSLVLLGRPVIRVLLEHGKFDAGAGSLTSAGKMRM